MQSDPAAHRTYRIWISSVKIDEPVPRVLASASGIKARPLSW